MAPAHRLFKMRHFLFMPATILTVLGKNMYCGDDDTIFWLEESKNNDPANYCPWAICIKRIYQNTQSRPP